MKVIVLDSGALNLLSVGKNSKSFYSGSVLLIQRTSSVATVELMLLLDNEIYSLLIPLVDVIR